MYYTKKICANIPIKYYHNNIIYIEWPSHVLFFLFIERGLLVPERPDGWGVRTPTPAVLFPHRFAHPRRAHTAPNVTSIKKRWRGWRMPSWRRQEETPRRSRRRQEGRCNTCNIRLKIDETLETCIETPAKTPKNTRNHCKNIHNIQTEQFNMCVKHMQHSNKHACNIHLQNR